MVWRPRWAAALIAVIVIATASSITTVHAQLPAASLAAGSRPSAGSLADVAAEWTPPRLGEGLVGRAAVQDAPTWSIPAAIPSGPGFSLGLLLILPIAVSALAGVGILWAPFAALICVAIARAKTLAEGPYARQGALCSALFLLPWVYLMFRLFGISLPSFIVKLAYGLLYCVWGIVLLHYLWLMPVLATDSPEADFPGWLLTLTLILFLAGMPAWLLSVIAVSTKSPRSAAMGKKDTALAGFLIGGDKLQPFGGLLAWTLLLIGLVTWASRYVTETPHP